MTTISPTPSDLHDMATMDQIFSAIHSAHEYTAYGSSDEVLSALEVMDRIILTCRERRTGISVRWLVSQHMSLGIDQFDAWQNLDSVVSDDGHKVYFGRAYITRLNKFLKSL